MGYAAWHSSFIPPGSLVRSPLTVPGRHKGLRPCGGMYPLTQVGFWKRARPSVGAREVRSGGGGLFCCPRLFSRSPPGGDAVTSPPPRDPKKRRWRRLQKHDCGNGGPQESPPPPPTDSP